MESRKLGTQGLVVSALGLGCMGMTVFYGEVDHHASEEANIELIGHAVSSAYDLLIQVETAKCYPFYR
jgi:aryl-alcohol dehydrogenase-like predicted oxidoreductase